MQEKIKIYGIRLAIIMIIVIIGIILLKPFFRYLSDYLSQTNKVKADILLVEGWLPPSSLELAYNEYRNNGYKHIITTGISVPEYDIVPCDGYLVFYTKKFLKGEKTNGRHIIEVNAYSELDGVNSAHFNLYVNDSLISDFYAQKQVKNYKSVWYGNLNNLDSVIVQFNNDATGEFGDRNLYVKELIIDHKIKIPYQNNSIYYYWRLGWKDKIFNDFGSYAEQARDILIKMGVDSSLITAVPGNSVIKNRTLTSALAFREWLVKSNYKVEAINVITLGTHARRSWMVYTRILQNSTRVGIISLPDYENSRRYRAFRVIHETIGIIYYWIILFLYQQF
jgi:hypothetical protein